MKEIDFLPTWYVADQRARTDRVVRIGYLGAVVLGITVLAFVRQARTAAAESTMATLRSDLGGSTAPDDGPSRRRARWQEQNRKRALLADVKGGAPVHALIAELSAFMPEAMLISELHLIEGQRFAGTADPATNPPPSDPGRVDGRFQVRGFAASDAHVGDLMSGLSGSALFADVNLGYSRPVEMDGRQAREFELSGRLPAFE